MYAVSFRRAVQANVHFLNNSIQANLQFNLVRIFRMVYFQVGSAVWKIRDGVSEKEHQ